MKGVVASSGKEGICVSCGRNNEFILVLVLFILLVIVLTALS
ncbi:YjcZ family sporulation protein [Brevibacillus reuszeri]